MDFAELRQTIPALTSMIYLNTGWAGPSPERVLGRMRETAEEESRVGPASPDGIALARRIDDEATEAAARLLHAPKEDVLVTHGTTEGVNIVMHGIAWEPSDEVLTCDLEHPALRAPTALLEQRREVTVNRLALSPKASADEALEAVRRAITPRTRLVALSHIMFTCGLLLPAAELAAAVHEAGALLLLDGAQTGGQIRLDMEAINADFYAISGQKWLFGPTGSGALYVRHALQELLTPVTTAPGVGSRPGLRGHRLTSGSAVLNAGFAEAIHLHQELGPQRVEARTLELSSRLKADLSALPGVSLTGPSDPDVSCGLATVAAEGWVAAELAGALWERYRIAGRTVAYPEGVRFSTAPFNNEDDVGRVVEAVSQLVG